jgi:predicted anti-sigma-YlaC factor YlaD
VTALHPDCERARCVASLRLDDEATDFERVFLSAHVQACADCRAYTAGVEETVEALRAAPLAETAVSFRAPRRRRTYLRHAPVAATALVLLGAGVSAFTGVPHGQQGLETVPVAHPAPRVPTPAAEARVLRASGSVVVQTTPPRRAVRHTHKA